MQRYFLCFIFPVLAFWMTFSKDLLAVFFVFSILGHHFINWRRQSMNMCLCCCFWPTFALDLSEINCLWNGSSGYSRMLWNDALCKSIASFYLIDKQVFHMPLKALVLTTHAVSTDKSKPLRTDQKIKSLVSQLKTKHKKDQSSWKICYCNHLYHHRSLWCSAVLSAVRIPLLHRCVKKWIVQCLCKQELSVNYLICTKKHA